MEPVEKISIRPIRQPEILLLTDFLYEAIYQRDGDPPVPRTILQQPSVWRYIEGFGGKPDDLCLVAETAGLIVGAVWVRCIGAYGYVDDGTPEFALSVYPQYRGRGIGTRLMREMIALLRDKGYAKASLAVQKDNYARFLYRKVGFELLEEAEQEFIMVCRLGAS